jgi:hypothetical protein
VAPSWLTTLAWTYLSVCFLCSATITFDIVVNRRRQHMGVMNFVFPITALYFGPFALAFYWKWARATARPTRGAPADVAVPAMAMATPGGSDDGHGDDHRPTWVSRSDAAVAARPDWASMAIEVSHCGSGCTLGDVIAEFAIFALGLTIAGLALPVEYVGDYLLAVTFGIVFQYFAIAPMRGLGLKDGLKAAAKADVISLTAFEIGLFGWMAVMTFVFFPAPHHLDPSFVSFWFLMQIGMIIGFFCSWPANVWLVKRGIKVPM